MKLQDKMILILILKIYMIQFKWEDIDTKLRGY